MRRIGRMQVVVWVLLFSTEVMGQQKRLSFGPRIGPAIIPVEKTESEHRNYRLGLSGGAYVDVVMHPIFSVRAEVNYTLRRQIDIGTDTLSLLDNVGGLFGLDTSLFALPAGINLNVYSTTTHNFNLHYIDIPLLGVVHLRNMKIMAGPYLSVLAGATDRSVLKQDIPVLSLVDLNALGNFPFIDVFINQLFPGYTSPSVDDIRGTAGLKKIDIGITADITYQLENNLNMGIRLQRGFIDFRRSPTGESKFNTSWQFLLGYRFGKARNEGPIIRPRANIGED